MFSRRALALITIILATAAAARAEGGVASFEAYDDESTRTVDNRDYADFLETYARDDESGVVLVAYGDVSYTDHQALKNYIGSLASLDPTTLNRDEAFAYWANLYNAVTLDVILDNYPVDSIRDIRPGLFATGPWKTERVKVNGVELSLDNIEHDILRAFWDEPRVHYAVNCASIGCPNLPLTPLTAAGLDDRLDEAARAYINHPRGVSVENGRVNASSIYKWFVEDFGGDEEGVLEHVAAYAEPPLKAALQSADGIASYDYDWSLNDAKK